MGFDLYPWVKVVHIVAVISWMAGLLYLPRLFVYHCKAEPGAQYETFAVMERRLLRAIMGPAMIVTWVAGIVLAIQVVAWDVEYWIYAKIALVLGLTGVHHRLAQHVRAFAEERNRHSERYFRILNEVPTVLMIAIVVLVVVRPF